MDQIGILAGTSVMANEGYGESAGGGECNPRTGGVRCMVHNFPDDDDDAESTIRSLLEPDLIVRHCQPSTSGLFDSSFCSENIDKINQIILLR